MARLLSGLALLIFFISCTEQVPQDVVPKRIMPDLLFDVHVLDGELSQMPVDSIRMLIGSSYQAIFNRYGIDSVQFDRSIDYYSKRPAEFTKIYAIVNKRVQALVDEDQRIRAAQYREQVTADSLKAITVRDSLYWRSIDSLDWINRRHLLLRHEADSTRDKPVPVTFRSYSNGIFEQAELWFLTDKKKQSVTVDLLQPAIPAIY